MTDILIGLALAAATVGSARLIGFDRDQALYPVVLIVIAWLYVLFAAIDGRLAVIVPEAIAALVFSVVAIAGYKWSAWWLVAGYALHGAWNLFHNQIIASAGVVAGVLPGLRRHCCGLSRDSCSEVGSLTTLEAGRWKT